VLLARTTPIDEIERKTQGLSTFLVDMRAAGKGLTITPIKTMINHSTTELFFDELFIPDDALIGDEGNGFKQILSGMNVERIMIASECVGDGRYFIDKAAAYSAERQVFGRPIGSNQGIQFPLAKAHAQVEAASLMRHKAAALYETDKPCGAEANMAKLLASEASWAAANACMDTFGGFAFADEYDIGRKFRETRLYSIAPVSNNLVLAHIGQHVLGMPRSY
jgi:acyl-CoA dehydrogenase